MGAKDKPAHETRTVRIKDVIWGDEIEGEGGSANAEQAPRTERPAPRKLDEAKVVEAVLKSIPGVIDAALARHKGRLTDEDLS